VTFGGVVAALAAAAILASYLPAWGASRVGPVVAPRGE
jgi:ABC-type lipoprotein release transport system permease subunit